METFDGVETYDGAFGTYPTELPVLRDLLPDIQTPVQIIAGTRNRAVLPVNAEFLHERRQQHGQRIA